MASEKLTRMRQGEYGETLQKHAEAFQALMDVQARYPLSPEEGFMFSSIVTDLSLAGVPAQIPQQSPPQGVAFMSEFAMEFARAMFGKDDAAAPVSWSSNLQQMMELMQSVYAAGDDGGHPPDAAQVSALLPPPAVFAQLQASMVQSSLGALMRPHMGAAAKQLKNPKARSQAAARKEIRSEWDRWQANASRYENDEDFGRKMHAKHAESYKSERTISNLSRKWRAGSA